MICKYCGEECDISPCEDCWIAEGYFDYIILTPKLQEAFFARLKKHNEVEFENTVEFIIGPNEE
jgi:hypothetical protein